MKKAIAYYKVSSNNQNKKPSVESQQNNCEEYAKKNGYRIVKKVLGDSNETQAIAALLNQVEEKKVDYLIAEHPDRISRNQAQYFWFKHQLSRMGVKLRFANIDADESPTGILMEGVLKAINNFDNELRSGQNKEGIRQAA